MHPRAQRRQAAARGSVLTADTDDGDQTRNSGGEPRERRRRAEQGRAQRRLAGRGAAASGQRRGTQGGTTTAIRTGARATAADCSMLRLVSELEDGPPPGDLRRCCPGGPGTAPRLPPAAMRRLIGVLIKAAAAGSRASAQAPLPAEAHRNHAAPHAAKSTLRLWSACASGPAHPHVPGTNRPSNLTFL